MHFIRKRNERVYRVCDKSYVACTFQVQKFRNDGTITYQGPVFSNLVLNVGLDLLATEVIDVSVGIGRYMNVGTDNTAPAQTQTGLLAFVAATQDRYYSDSATGYSVDAPAHKWWQETKEFAIGTFTGQNLTELGLSALENSNYFNRQLFKDEAGDPTTITVLSDEGLRVTARIYFYPDLQLGGTETGSFVLNGSTTKNFTRELDSGGQFLANDGEVRFDTAGSPDLFELSDSNTAWTGIDASSVNQLAYGSGDHYLDYECVWNAGVFVGDLDSIIFDLYLYGEGYYRFTAFRLDSVISVADTDEVKFTFRRAWGRYVA